MKSILIPIIVLGCVAVAGITRAATHTVVAGDTLSTISHRLGITVQVLRHSTQIEGDKIQPAQHLRLPDAGVQGGRVHVVKLGDTLFRLSKHYGVSVARIMYVNRLTGDFLLPGVRLVIPSGTAAPGKKSGGVKRYTPMTPSASMTLVVPEMEPRVGEIAKVQSP